jgi:hypothetical protein
MENTEGTVLKRLRLRLRLRLPLPLQFPHFAIFCGSNAARRLAVDPAR